MAVEAFILAFCLEGFLYGKTSVLYALTCTFAKEVQSFPGVGIYSGIFTIYIQHPSKESRTATIIFYALCLLYVLSTATFVCDFITFIIGVSNNFIWKNIIFLLVMQTRVNLNTLSPQLRIDSELMLSRLSIAQSIANSCCDFIAQCTLVRINHNLPPLYPFVLFT